MFLQFKKNFKLMANTEIKNKSENFLTYIIDLKIKNKVDQISPKVKCLSDRYL